MYKSSLTPQTPVTPTFSTDAKTAKLQRRPAYYSGSADSPIPMRKRPASSSLNNNNRNKYDD